MPDSHDQDIPQRGDWAGAFATMPLDAPDASAWPAIRARLDARRRMRWPLWLATAAALTLVAVLPLRQLAEDAAARTGSEIVATAVPATATATAPSAAADGSHTRSDFERLYAESARLEAVLDVARDDRVTSGPAAALSGELDAYLTSIDATLSQPALPQAQRLALWGRRVDALRQVTGFASTQRWLAANGDRYDGALVSVD